MTNLNSKTIFISPNYVCGREKKLHTCLLASSGSSSGTGMAGADGRRRDVRVNVRRNLTPHFAEARLSFVVLFLVVWLINL